MISRQEFEKPYFFLLESLAGGRYSIAGWDPIEVLVIEDGMKEDPFEILRRRLRTSKQGGWIGYLGYEAYSFLHDKVPLRAPVLIPKGVFCWYDRLRFYPPTLLSQRSTSPRPSLQRRGRIIHSNFTKSQYLDAIRRIKNYLLDGDCYQVNLSQKFSCSTSMGFHELYLKLRENNPAPYSAYLNLGDAQILSSSPECFLEVNGRDVITRPIKGTRRRGATEKEDAWLKQELSESHKDRAELLMITDLERNDLGKVCEAGSIFVPMLREIQSFRHVHHTVSTIQGRLRQDQDTIDLLKATFPGGSITGAPKTRAMQIIHEMEKDPREVYCGTIGYLSSDGRAAFNIAIRTLLLKDGRAHFWSGGGIVADSDPEAEYEETLVKAEGMMVALE